MVTNEARHFIAEIQRIYGVESAVFPISIVRGHVTEPQDLDTYINHLAGFSKKSGTLCQVRVGNYEMPGSSM